MDEGASSSLDIPDFGSICRVCLQKNQETRPLDDLMGQSSSLKKLIKTTICSKGFKETGMPSRICKVCANAFLCFYEFQKCCWRNEACLLDMLSHSKGKKNDLSQLNHLSGGDQQSIVAGKKRKQHQCMYCMRSFTSSRNLRRHIPVHTGEKPHACEACEKRFARSSTLKKHMKVHMKLPEEKARRRKFGCTDCGRTFRRLGNLLTHHRKHLSGDEGASVKTDKPGLPRIEQVCERCAKTYKTVTALRNHQLTHGEKTFLCSECGKQFFTKAALDSHSRVHTGEKPHICNVCQRSFAQIASFESHILTHNGSRPHNCNVCSKAFTQMSSLKCHQRTHSGEKPYGCSHCGKTFSLKGSLTVHTRIHTGETPYKCPVCGKGFCDASNMKKHARIHDKVSTPKTKNLPSLFSLDSVGEPDSHFSYLSS